MSLSNVILTGMRETDDLFCSTVVRLRNIEALNQIYTHDAHVLPRELTLSRVFPPSRVSGSRPSLILTSRMRP